MTDARCIPPPAPTGHFVPCETCGGYGFLLVADSPWGPDEDRCPTCNGAREVWVRHGVRDTVPAPAPDGCTEAAE